MKLAVEGTDRLEHLHLRHLVAIVRQRGRKRRIDDHAVKARQDHEHHQRPRQRMHIPAELESGVPRPDDDQAQPQIDMRRGPRSEEHTSELQSLMRISYAVFCLKKKNKKTYIHTVLLAIETHIT